MSGMRAEWVTLMAVAETQHGIFTAAQAEQCGVTRAVRRGMVRRGVIEKMGAHTFRLTGAAPTLDQRCMAAVLDIAGTAAVGGFTAMALWGVPGFDAEVVRVLTPRDSAEPATRLGRSADSLALAGADVVRLRRIPVLTPTRLLFDVAHHVHEGRLVRAANWFGARGLTSGPKLHAMADRLRRRGRPGSAVMGELLESTFPLDWTPAESNLELRFESIIVEAGMPRPRRQVDVGSDDRWIGRCDFVDPDLPVIAEIQSSTFHVAPVDAVADEDRIAALRAVGFVVEEFAEFAVWHDKESVVRRWRSARWTARRRATSQVAHQPAPQPESGVEGG